MRCSTGAKYKKTIEIRLGPEKRERNRGMQRGPIRIRKLDKVLSYRNIEVVGELASARSVFCSRLPKLETLDIFLSV